MAKSATSKKKQKTILSTQSMAFLKNYINTPSPVGFESGGQKLWMEYIRPYVDSFITDPYGTAVGVINPTAPFKVVIEAHADEISWFVNYINEQGLIYLKRNGGVDHPMLIDRFGPTASVNIVGISCPIGPRQYGPPCCDQG